MPTLTPIENFIELEYKSGAHDYHPIPVVIEKGEGVYLWDIERKKYYDFLRKELRNSTKFGSGYAINLLWVNRCSSLNYKFNYTLR